jgi:hypothetical protein
MKNHRIGTDSSMNLQVTCLVPLQNVMHTFVVAASAAKNGSNASAHKMTPSGIHYDCGLRARLSGFKNIACD